MAMYKNSNSVIRSNSAVRDKFSVKTGVHEGSVLSPLLFIIVLESLLRECRNILPQEICYVDNLVIIAESLEELGLGRYAAWQNCIESKGVRVNLAKTKVMISYLNQGTTFTSGKHPCGVYCKVVGFNSMICSDCDHWVH